ncbi:hypothetical protein, conserved [Eimeria tenella]|uniref:Uncharacterized protein n=1 Tax=Eimeria tenella TaxID=5802 RepID=U6L157_EIMTE|nr:hypothetical protein, conserved [Eimeria tenella]CDJ41490.1 hypothetical protein, conserved [Eimeria tenella]|eukprot:XP_013232240.1 hypothetical protein, conserved [Eimeria tenella]
MRSSLTTNECSTEGFIKCRSSTRIAAAATTATAAPTATATKRTTTAVAATAAAAAVAPALRGASEATATAEATTSGVPAKAQSHIWPFLGMNNLIGREKSSDASKKEDLRRDAAEAAAAAENAIAENTMEAATGVKTDGGAGMPLTGSTRASTRLVAPLQAKAPPEPEEAPSLRAVEAAATSPPAASKSAVGPCGALGADIEAVALPAAARCICTDDPVGDLLQQHQKRSLPSLPLQLPLRLLLPYAVPYAPVRACNAVASKKPRKQSQLQPPMPELRNQLQREQQEEEQQHQQEQLQQKHPEEEAQKHEQQRECMQEDFPTRGQKNHTVEQRQQQENQEQPPQQQQLKMERKQQYNQEQQQQHHNHVQQEKNVQAKQQQEHEKQKQRNVPRKRQQKVHREQLHQQQQRPRIAVYTAVLLLEEVTSFCEQQVTLESLPHALKVQRKKANKRQQQKQQPRLRFSSLAAALVWLQQQLQSEGALLPAAAGCLCSSYRHAFDCVPQAPTAETAPALNGGGADISGATEPAATAGDPCVSASILKAATNEAVAALQLLSVFRSSKVATEAATLRLDGGVGAHDAYSSAAAAAAAWAAAASDPPPLQHSSSSTTSTDVLRIAAVGCSCNCPVKSHWVSLSAWRSFVLASHPSVRLYDLLLFAASQRRFFSAADSSPEPLQQLMEASAVVACMEQKHFGPPLSGAAAAAAAADTAIQCAAAAVRELVSAPGYTSNSSSKRVATWLAAANPFAAAVTPGSSGSSTSCVRQQKNQLPACLPFLVVLPEEDLLGNSGVAAAAADAERAWALGAPGAVPLVAGSTFYSAPSQDTAVGGPKMPAKMSRSSSSNDGSSISKDTESQQEASGFKANVAPRPGLPELRCFS